MKNAISQNAPDCLPARRLPHGSRSLIKDVARHRQQIQVSNKLALALLRRSICRTGELYGAILA
jgi:hypothetical protein